MGRVEIGGMNLRLEGKATCLFRAYCGWCESKKSR